MEKPEWIKQEFDKYSNGTSVIGVLPAIFVRASIFGGRKILTRTLSGSVVRSFKFSEALKDLNPYFIDYDCWDKYPQAAAGEDWIYYVQDHGTSAYMYIYAWSQSSLDALSTIGSNFLVPHKAKKDLVFMLVQEQNELSFAAVGVGGSPLERGNYSEEVLSGYDHLLMEFNEKDPCGRLSVFSGPPGTGKTHMIRALLDTGAAYFAFLPPQMVPSIGGPSIVGAVLDFHRTHPDKPLCLVLEDADECLVPRGSDNISSISSLLNASEGILGQIMDVRIIATTNAKVREFDKAIVRKGRMCSNIKMEKLPVSACNKILERLGVEPKAQDDLILADVYFLARELGWKTAASKSVSHPKESLGFKSETPKAME